MTKSLKLDFNANNNSIIGEPAGRVNADDHDEYKMWKDSVLTSLKNFGETTTYNHMVNLTYTLPFDKLPITDWITANATYGAGYQWDRAPLSQDSVGNTIQNSRNINLNGQFNFVLKAGNGETILRGEQYVAKPSVQANCASDERHERKESSVGRHYFNLKAANHKSAASRDDGIASVKNSGASTTIKDSTTA